MWCACLLNVCQVGLTLCIFVARLVKRIEQNKICNYNLMQHDFACNYPRIAIDSVFRLSYLHSGDLFLNLFVLVFHIMCSVSFVKDLHHVSLIIKKNM